MCNDAGAGWVGGRRVGVGAAGEKGRGVEDRDARLAGKENFSRG